MRGTGAAALRSSGGPAAARPRTAPLVTGAGMGSTARGLRNRGEDCFVNSAVQCLAHCRALREYFLADGHRVDCAQSGGLVAPQLGAALQRVWGASSCAADSGPTDATAVRQAVAERAEQFAGDGPGDASEFLAVLVAELHRDLNRSAGRQPPAELGEAKTGSEAWARYAEANDSIVSHLFCGVVQSDSCCGSCGHDERGFSEFTALNVWPPSRQSELAAVDFQLVECIDAALDRSQAVAQIFCSHCCDVKEGQALKSLARMPPVLMVHIQRYDADVLVDCPMILDLSAHSTESQGSETPTGQVGNPVAAAVWPHQA